MQYENNSRQQQRYVDFGRIGQQVFSEGNLTNETSEVPRLTDLEHTNYSTVTRCIRSVCCQIWEGLALIMP